MNEKEHREDEELVDAAQKREAMEEESSALLRRLMPSLELTPMTPEEFARYNNDFQRWREDDRRLEAVKDDLEPEEYEERRRQLLDAHFAEVAPMTPIQMTPRPDDYRPRSGWEQSLDPRASWQHSVRGLLPGTIFAILLALAALALYLYVSPVVGIIVGILAVLNGIVAVNHWVRLLAS